MSKRTEKVAELMEQALEEVERAVEVRLADEKVEERGRQAFRPSRSQSRLRGEILVRILEDEIGRKLGLTGHTPEEHLAELSAIFPHLRLTVKDYKELAEH